MSDKHSKSFVSRRHRPNQANVRSTTQRFGSTLNPGSDRLTISTFNFRRTCFAPLWNFGP
jgi:hypothetical protein